MNLLPQHTAQNKYRLNIGSFAKIIWHQIKELIWPTTCGACGQIIAPLPNHNTSALCPACYHKLTIITPPICQHLGTPLPYDLGKEAHSPAALASSLHHISRVRTASLYKGTAQTLVHNLKYRNMPQLAQLMATLMRQNFNALVTDKSILVSVPLHPVRLWQRGYNQAELLCHQLENYSGCIHYPALKRIKNTAPQVGLTKQQRQENLQNGFKLAPQFIGLVTGQNVILVDDVFTTGATAQACAHQLHLAGARTVDLAVFATVPLA
ncbi:ComF family protein [Polycladidibacter stylochi]|uniref:ComF family protein n=1 Tax=Polycladidibacter stylochi TaxID=1807766 RepID=UPI00083473B6|nr:ComF family protein [Pseudovibrio stylochi]